MKTVLAVDDSRSLRQMVTFILNNAGYLVTEAENGFDGLALAKKQSFDVILTDQNMPQMDGLTFIKSLRALPVYEKTPILMLTTEAGDDIKEKGRAAGATGWLVKPFDPERLIEVMNKVTHRV